MAVDSYNQKFERKDPEWLNRPAKLPALPRFNAPYLPPSLPGETMGQPAATAAPAARRQPFDPGSGILDSLGVQNYGNPEVRGRGALRRGDPGQPLPGIGRPMESMIPAAGARTLTAPEGTVAEPERVQSRATFDRARGSQGAIIENPGEAERRFQIALDSVMSRTERTGSGRRAQAEIAQSLIGRRMGQEQTEAARRNAVADRDMRASEMNMTAEGDDADRAFKTSAANVEAGLKRRGQDLDFSIEDRKLSSAGQLTARDLLEMEKLKAEQMREGQLFDAELQGKQDADFNSRIEARMKQEGVTYDQALAQESALRNRSGDDPRNYTAGRALDNQALQELADNVNDAPDSTARMLFGGDATPGTVMQLDEDQRAGLRWEDFEEAPVDSFANSTRDFFGLPKVTSLRYKTDQVKPGMSAPYRFYKEGDPAVEAVRLRRRTPPSGF